MFQCGRCGRCCRQVGKAKVNVDLDRGDGVCRFLNESTNLCSIYNNRPLICNIDRAYDEMYSDLITREEFYEINYEACKTFEREAGGEENVRI